MREFITAHKALFVGALIMGATPLLTALAAFDPAKITDWRAWVVGIGAASVRQIAAYLITKLSQ